MKIQKKVVINQRVKQYAVSRSGRLILATIMLAVAHTGANAEIDRVSISDTLQELHEAKRAVSPDRNETSFPIRGFVSRLPDMARVALPDGTELKSTSIRAIFGVEQPGGEIGDTKTVRMKQADDGTYGVAWRSKRAFRSWLLKRTDALFQGNVVLERIVGLAPDGISFRLSIEEVSEDLFALADAEWEKDRGERALEQISGTSITEAAFDDLEGGARRFAEFEGRTLLLHIWATWCAPCVAEMPALEALQDRYRDSGLTVVNLSDEPGDTIRDWLSENPSTMVHGQVDAFGFLLGNSPPEGVDRSLGSRPVYVVVDREGTVQKINVGFVKTTGPEGESDHYAAEWLRPYFQ